MGRQRRAKRYLAGKKTMSSFGFKAASYQKANRRRRSR